jgi:hypothetical protein
VGADRRLTGVATVSAGLLQVRLVGAREPVLTQTRVDRFLSSPQRVDVGTVGGESGRDLETLGNGPWAGARTSAPGSPTQSVECRLASELLTGGDRLITGLASQAPVRRIAWSYTR